MYNEGVTYWLSKKISKYHEKLDSSLSIHTLREQLRFIRIYWHQLLSKTKEVGI